VQTPLTLKQSLRNFRSNVPILLFLIILLIAYSVIFPRHNEMIWTVALVLIVKAESRPQPIAVTLLAFAVTAVSIIVLSNFRGMRHPCEWSTIVLLIPLVLSKWLFGVRR
jgi:hypothetical protein